MTGQAQPDWTQPLDYYKWTMALAVAAVVYVPEHFLPAGGLRYAAVVVASGLLSISCLLGFLLFGGIAKRLSGRSGERPAEHVLDGLGFGHLLALIGGFVIAVTLYFVDSFLGAASDIACRVEIRSGTGSVSFDLDSCTVAGGT